MQKNNFDFLRLLFALFVVFDHSYYLSGAPACEYEWMCRYTSDTRALSFIGLKGFFAISGFLIFNSIQKTDSLTTFYWKRILRIFPALIVLTLLTVLLAPFVYQNNQVSYWHNKGVWQYFVGNISIFTRRVKIEGIFENNPYKQFINGSLWTIKYEVLMYVLFSGLFFFRKNIKATKSILIIFFIVLSAANVFYFLRPQRTYEILELPILAEVGCYFVCGSILACFKIDKSRYRKTFLLIAVGVLVLLPIIASFDHFWVLLGTHIFLSTTIICIGSGSTKFINSIEERIGDLSYGVYIYSFPIQQTLVYYFGLNPYQLMISAAAIAICCGLFSWHVVEKKALQLKNIQPLEYLRQLFLFNQRTEKVREKKVG